MQLELKLGIGGTSYEDFIRSMHLPIQLRCVLASEGRIVFDTCFVAACECFSLKWILLVPLSSISNA